MARRQVKEIEEIPARLHLYSLADVRAELQVLRRRISAQRAKHEQERGQAQLNMLLFTDDHSADTCRERRQHD